VSQHVWAFILCVFTTLSSLSNPAGYLKDLTWHIYMNRLLRHDTQEPFPSQPQPYPCGGPLGLVLSAGPKSQTLVKFVLLHPPMIGTCSGINELSHSFFLGRNSSLGRPDEIARLSRSCQVINYEGDCPWPLALLPSS
jgi:hypothetical protein